MEIGFKNLIWGIFIVCMSLKNDKFWVALIVVLFFNDEYRFVKIKPDSPGESLGSGQVAMIASYMTLCELLMFSSFHVYLVFFFFFFVVIGVELVKL